MKELPVRKPNRLKGYDYRRSGCYFVTICAKDRHEMLGTITVGDGLAHPASVELSEIGKIVDEEIKKIASHYEGVRVDEYVIMPNHIHAIIIVDCSRGTRDGRARPLLGNIVGGLKSGVSRLCGFAFWQRSFHDRVIRNETEYIRIVEYIENNPLFWQEDCFYPK